jgi:acyl carrier protein
LSAAFEQIRGIASDIFAVPRTQIVAESSPETIGSWDSTQHLSFILAIEEVFGLQLSPEEIEQARNIGEVTRIVQSRLQAAGR